MPCICCINVAAPVAVLLEPDIDLSNLAADMEHSRVSVSWTASQTNGSDLTANAVHATDTPV